MSKKRKLEYFLKEKNIFLLIIILSFLTITSPFILRALTFNDELIGSQAYHHIFIVNNLRKGNLFYDDFNNKILFDAYDYILLSASSFLPLKLASRILPSLFSFFSLLLFYLLLKKFNVDKLTRTLTMFILILSPSFIYSFTFFPSHTFYSFILLLSFFLLLQESSVSKILSFLFFAFIPFLNPLLTLITLFLLINLAILNPKNNKHIKYIIFIILIISFFYYIHLYFNLPLPLTPPIEKNSLTILLVSDLGSSAGFSIFTLMLFILGIFSVLKNKKFFLVLILSLILLLISIYFSYSLIYLNFIISIIAAFGFVKLIRMKWELELIKNLTIFILLCGILFSSISYISRITTTEPSPSLTESLTFLENKEKGIVLSNFKYGSFIKEIAKKKPLLDESFFLNKKTKLNDINYLFSTTNLKEAQHILDKYNIRYILIDKKMEESIWHNKEEKFLLLLTNKEIFKNIYSKNGVRIWEYKK